MGNSQIYYLDLQTLLSYLRNKSAILHTSIPVAKSRETGQGTLLLKQGTLFACFLHSSTGVLLSQGESAYKALMNSTKWEVSLETEQAIEETATEIRQKVLPPASTSSLPSMQKNSYIPQQMRPLNDSLLEGLSAQQCIILRSVLAMVNGERTVEQIKARLHLLPNSVEEALSFLREKYIIR